MAIDSNDPRPPYRQLADDLRRKIRAGEYPPGTRLPSIREFATEYAISPQTVQNGLRELRGEGLIVSQQGRAFFVRDPGRPASGPDGDITARIAALEAGLEALRSQADKSESDLREQIAALRIQVLDLQARAGQGKAPRKASP